MGNNYIWQHWGGVVWDLLCITHCQRLVSFSKYFFPFFPPHTMATSGKEETLCKYSFVELGWVGVKRNWLIFLSFNFIIQLSVCFSSIISSSFYLFSSFLIPLYFLYYCVYFFRSHSVYLHCILQNCLFLFGTISIMFFFYISPKVLYHNLFENCSCLWPILISEYGLLS